MLDSDEADNTAQEATQTLHEINALYQDIETILTSDQTPANKLAAITVKNRQIGQITAEWI